MTVLDRAHFEHMTAGDPGLQAEIVSLFQGQVNDWMAAVGAEGWRDAVHKLKGSARGIGLDVLAAACEAAERASAAETRGAIAGVRAALEQAVTALTPFAAERV